MATDNFNRQYRFTARAEGNEFTVGEPNDHGYAIHIKFDVERSDSETLNTSQIALWNLNADEIALLMTTGCNVALQAGYNNNLQTIFTGTVTAVNVELDKADRKVTLDVVDGITEVSDVYVSIEITETKSCKDIIEMVAEQMGIPTVYGEGADKWLQTYSYYADEWQSRTFMGTAGEVLDDMCGRVLVTWFVQNGVLTMTKGGESVTGELHVISPDTGLIGIPGRVYNSAVSSDEGDSVSDELYGYELVYLINGAINVGDIVDVQSNTVQGTFLVYRLSISGDNVEGDWQCTADVTEYSA